MWSSRSSAPPRPDPYSPRCVPASTRRSVRSSTVGATCLSDVDIGAAEEASTAAASGPGPTCSSKRASSPNEIGSAGLAGSATVSTVPARAPPRSPAARQPASPCPHPGMSQVEFAFAQPDSAQKLLAESRVRPCPSVSRIACASAPGCCAAIWRTRASQVPMAVPPLGCRLSTACEAAARVASRLATSADRLRGRRARPSQYRR